MNRKLILSSLFSLASLSFCLPVAAATVNNNQMLGYEVTTNSVAIDNYWTPERLKNAKPMPLPRVNVNALKDEQQLPSLIEGDEPSGGDGKGPTINTKIGFQQLFVPTENGVFKTSQSSHTLVNHFFNRGSSNENFTSSRLVPLTADLVYPYRAVGKLFFTIPGQGDFVCSAAVLRPRVLLTAGHCVHRGSGGTAGYYTNWKFIPAFRDGAAPLQTWNAVYALTTPTWASGGGTVPNAADYAMLELADKTIGGAVQKIGAVTGYFGYQTLSLIPNHAHLLGYPCNLDSCQKMHQVAAQSARSVSPNNAEYGSDMRGGSSGGPWVQNFGVAATGQTAGTNTGINRIVGVTSWGYTSTTPLAQGASIPDERFLTLLTSLCNHKAGNC